MKKLEIKELNRSNIDDYSKYYTVFDKANDRKYQIRKDETGFYAPYTLIGFTASRKMDRVIECDHLPAYLFYLISNKYEVYEFDSFIEFAKWFSEEKKPLTRR